ncbi:hypothetical protein D3C71_1493550 [compost metagenome]
MIAVLAAVLDQPRPRIAPTHGAPHVLVSLRRHVRVANDVVGLTNEFVVSESAHTHEGWVAMGDLALGVCARHKQLITGEIETLLCYRQIDAHGSFLKGLRVGRSTA